jgi:acyl carrier protein
MNEKFLKLFSEIIESEDHVAFEMKLDDIRGWDSLARLTLISMVDDEYGVIIGHKDLEKMVKLSDVLDFIVKAKVRR